MFKPAFLTVDWIAYAVTVLFKLDDANYFNSNVKKLHRPTVLFLRSSYNAWPLNTSDLLVGSKIPYNVTWLEWKLGFTVTEPI